MIDAILERALCENLALRCILGGGCDANNDGAHTTMGKGSDEFCINCGEMTRGGKSKPWMDEARLERTMARLAASGIETEGHDRETGLGPEGEHAVGEAGDAQ